MNKLDTIEKVVEAGKLLNKKLGCTTWIVGYMSGYTFTRTSELDNPYTKSLLEAVLKQPDYYAPFYHIWNETHNGHSESYAVGPVESDRPVEEARVEEPVKRKRATKKGT